MSTTTMDETNAEVRTFRGASLEELLPQVREALGSDAVVLRQRDGLTGGIGGFFQRRFVEIEAKRGGPRIDVYDEEPGAAPGAAPDAFAALLAAAGSEEEDAAVEEAPRSAAAPAEPDGAADDAPRSAAVPAELDAAAATAPYLVAELTGTGMSHAFAQRVVADAEAHELPFARGDLRAAVRRALARRLPTTMPHRAGGLAVAFAGPGSTDCADALVSAYKLVGREARVVASLDRARTLLERDDADAVFAVDLPPVAAERDEAEALAARVERLALDEVIAVLPSELDLPAARVLLDRMRPLGVTGIALSVGVRDVALGAGFELACSTRLPLAYVRDALAIAPADPATLAERLLP